MMKTLFLVFNHQFILEQEADARASLGVDRIEGMPEHIGLVWGHVPPAAESVGTHLDPVKTWLLEHAKAGDYVLIQGDFGACYLLVKFCFKNHFIPVYATTRREAAEELQPDGTVKMTHHFKHQRFREYGQ